jgi:hypothetical protein
VDKPVGKMMSEQTHPGKIDIEIDGRRHTVHYEISNYDNGWFNLTILYNGKKLVDRVPARSFDLHRDVAATHGEALLRTMLQMQTK